MNPKLLKIRQKAEQDPKLVFTSLYHHVYDVAHLRECYHSLEANKAAGVDGEDKETYGQKLEENLTQLSERLARMGYRPPPSLRKYIAKPGSDKMRPLGISSFEAKIVEKSLKLVLEQIYEPMFLDCSYGYRSGRRAHQAVDALGLCIQQQKVRWVVEADIKGFFDHVNHQWLLRFLGHRVGDPRIVRLINRFLRAGIMEDGLVCASEQGTPQGSVLSPLLSNIYLHYVLDLWFDKRISAGSQKTARLFRYADDFVACFAAKADAERYLAALGERLGQFHLAVEPSKTKLLEFGLGPALQAAQQGRRLGTFDFLGFTFYWDQTRAGWRKLKRKTAAKKFRQKLVEMKAWLKAKRCHLRLGELMATVRRKLQGHFNYFGITDNYVQCQNYRREVLRLLYKWLNRRSQRRSYDWKGFTQMINGWAKLPVPRIKTKMDPLRKAKLA